MTNLRHSGTQGLRDCSRLLVALALSALAAPAARGAARAEPATVALPGYLWPTHEVQVEFLEKAPTPTLEAIKPYSDALALYKYRVASVKKGELAADTIAVYHWVIWRDVVQPISQARPGQKVNLSLSPYDRVQAAFQTVFRSDLASALTLPTFYDMGQKVQGPASERGRWDYGLALSGMIRLMFHLKDQLKLVALGDCQAWFANKAELFMEQENRRAPVAISMCQERSGLPFQKWMVDDYLVHLPKLEWVILTWNPRFVNAAWTEHGIKGGQFAASQGFRYDREHEAEIWQPGPGPLVTVAQIEASPVFYPIWQHRRWGWYPSARYGSSARPEVLGNQRKLGTYKFLPERWEIFESIVKALADRDVRLLAYTTPVHPETANQPVKDKSGVDAPGYQDQVRRMHELEKKFPKHLFFYDFNKMGDNGLDDRDFGNIDHVTSTGAQKTSEKVEAFRKAVEARLGPGRRRESAECGVRQGELTKGSDPFFTAPGRPGISSRTGRG